MGDLLKSKKFQAAIVGAVVVVVAHFQPGWAETAEKVVMLLMTFIAGQGLADFGKEKAKVEIEVE
jgi:hypothetical protein